MPESVDTDSSCEWRCVERKVVGVRCWRQLGGRFSLNTTAIDHTFASATQLQARLICTRKTKAGKRTNRDIKWQEEGSVYLKQPASGVEALLLFELPETCAPSKQWSGGSSIEWQLTVEGQLSAPEKLERSWQKEAQALKNAIVDRCFDRDQHASAA